MPYLGATELTAILPQNVLIDASTSPLNLGEVATIIYEIGAELDGAAAARGYTVPIPTTAAEAYALMQSWTKLGAGWRALRIIFPNPTGQAGSNSLASDYRDAYRAALASLKKGEVALVGAPDDTGVTSRELPRSFSTSFGGAASSGVLAHITTDTVF